MSSAQDKWVLAAIAVSESAWLYAILGVAALPLQLGSNPLDWFAVLAVLASSLVVSRALQALIISTTTAYLAQMFTGLVVIYLVLGSQFSAGLDLAWAGRLSGELGSDTYWLRAAIAAAMVGRSLVARRPHRRERQPRRDAGDQLQDRRRGVGRRGDSRRRRSRWT